MAVEARRYARVNLAAYAQISSVKGDINEEYNAVCTDISEGGCRLEVARLLSGADIDFSVRVAIMMPDTMTRLITSGKIIWLKEESEVKVGRYAIGIKFQELRSEDKERIRNFVQTWIINDKIQNSK